MTKETADTGSEKKRYAYERRYTLGWVTFITILRTAYIGWFGWALVQPETTGGQVLGVGAICVYFAYANIHDVRYVIREYCIGLKGAELYKRFLEVGVPPGDQRFYRSAVKDLFNQPLEEVARYINDDDPYVSEAAQWRLKRGV